MHGLSYEDRRRVDIFLRGCQPTKKKSLRLNQCETIRKIGRLEFLRRILVAHPALFWRVYDPFLRKGGQKKQRFHQAALYLRRHKLARTYTLRRILENSEVYERHLESLRK